MEIEVRTDLVSDLPEEERPQSKEETMNYLKMLQGTVESSFDEMFSPKVKIIASNDIEGKNREFSIDDPNWNILCFGCNRIVAKGLEAQEAYQEFENHIEDESNPCIRRDHNLDRKLSRVKKMQEAFQDD